MQRLKQFAGIVVMLAFVLALRHWNRSSTHDGLKSDLLDQCEGDQSCVGAVHSHFEACFSDHYRTGRGSDNGMDQEGFLRCFNDRAGHQHFSLAH